MVLAALAVAGCASRQSASTTEAVLTAPPVNYETTVTTYFDLTTRTPPAQRKLQFGAPEGTRCRILGNVGSHTGWVVPVTYEVTAPPMALASPMPSSPALPVVAAAPAAKPAPAPKGKAAKGKKGAADKTVTTTSAAAPTAVAAAVVQAPPAPAEANPIALENVSVTGKTRYFFWFDRETINAVTKRMDICP